MTYLLTALLAAAAGWCWGHSTARIRHVPIGAPAQADEAALQAQLADIAARWEHGHTELTDGCTLCTAEYAEAFDLIHKGQQ
ncbi:hypothetical protein ACIQMV_08605 [Streptomyces sp. NPDC091412]|uniref:hypothetical protein n=1 Tax=Streptomyces sp. NPDC091412 TaxID=3366002 RepID=UPI00380394CE